MRRLHYWGTARRNGSSESESGSAKASKTSLHQQAMVSRPQHAFGTMSAQSVSFSLKSGFTKFPGQLRTALKATVAH